MKIQLFKSIIGKRTKNTRRSSNFSHFSLCVNFFFVNVNKFEEIQPELAVFWNKKFFEHTLLKIRFILIETWFLHDYTSLKVKNKKLV